MEENIIAGLIGLFFLVGVAWFDLSRKMDKVIKFVNSEKQEVKE